MLDVLAWWQDRRRLALEPAERLERVTFHVKPSWVEAIRREADLCGDTQARVVDRAFTEYFLRKDT